MTVMEMVATLGLDDSEFQKGRASSATAEEPRSQASGCRD
jgi:hypothetical protein